MGVLGNYLSSNFRIKLYVNTNPDLTDELSSVSELLVWALQLQHPEYYEMWEKNCKQIICMIHLIIPNVNFLFYLL